MASAKIDGARGHAEIVPQNGAPLSQVSDDTKSLIASSVSKNTVKQYQWWSLQIETWLQGRILNDALLADYITELFNHGNPVTEESKRVPMSPSTISQAVAAVRWQAKNAGIEIVGEISTKTLAGIRREGKDRGRGQVDGLVRSDVERVCAFAEMDKSIAGLRDSAMIRLMSDCLLRVSEVVAVNVDDVKDKTLLVKQSKTDQLGAGEMLYVTSDTRRVIRRYCKAGGIDAGSPVPFRPAGRSHPRRCTRR